MSAHKVSLPSPLLPGYPRNSFHKHTDTHRHTLRQILYIPPIFHWSGKSYFKDCKELSGFLVWGPCMACKHAVIRTTRQCQKKVKKHPFLLYRHFAPQTDSNDHVLLGSVITGKKKKNQCTFRPMWNNLTRGHSSDVPAPRDFSQHSGLPDRSQMYFLDLKKPYSWDLVRGVPPLLLVYA